MRPAEAQQEAQDVFWYQLTRLLTGGYFSLVHRLQWQGTEHLPSSGPAIVAANHQSYYDPVVLALATPRTISFVGWRRFFRYPLLGFLLRRYGTVPVDLDSPEPSAYGALVKVLEQGRLCGIFPEGGRTKDGVIEPPKSGIGGLALRSGAPIVPATISGAFRAWPVGRRLPRPGVIRVVFQRPVRVEEAWRRECEDERALRKRIALEVMLRIADGFELLGEPERRVAARQRLLAACD